MIDQERGDGRPTTAKLRSVLARASRVVIAEGAPDEADSGDVSRITVSGTEIADLGRLLAIVDGGTGDLCLCRGWPTILVYSGDELIARWTLHHQSGLRGVGNCDADLVDGPALSDWLAERGLTRSREVQAELALQKVESDQRRIRWIQAAPAGLGKAAEAVANPPGRDHASWSRRQDVVRNRLAAQVRSRLPETTERIRALLAWLGVAAREPGGGLVWYDLAVERLLLAESADAVLAALVGSPPSPAHLDGAAQLFCSLEWTKLHGNQLPEPLKSMLHEHIESDGTDPMRRRLSWGTYGARRTD
ncbi:hypothetical protein [Actinomadura sp. NPDC049753]|uniref:hypothetical protein n=1 Tax=Actinomadura sp. NPDC049753 TaxID=3154739 RepID=UPI003439771B